MTLKEFAGVFSRYFVIGFFAPAFFAVVLVSQVVDPEFFPVSYREASGTAKVAILGGVALLAGLLLSGLHYHVTRLFEGYPLSQLHGRRLIGWPHDRLLDHWRAEFDRRTEALAGEPSPERTRAAQDLSRSFPARRESILPTRFGNAVRAFETHGRRRYGLEGISAWPRISMLLSDAEREQVTEAQTDVAFFLNLALASVAGVVAVAVDSVWHPAGPDLAVVLWIIVALCVGAAVYWAAYRAATAAAMRWGSPVRAAYDLHRLEFYDRLGLVQPRDQDHEEAIARVANRLLVFGEPIPDAFRRQPGRPKEVK